MMCIQFREEASAFLDGELPEGSHRSLFRHLGACDECWTFYRRIEAIHEALNERSPEQGPQAVVPLLARRITLPAATMVLGVFLTFLTAVLITLAGITVGSGRLEQEERYSREENPAPYLIPGRGSMHGPEGRLR